MCVYVYKYMYVFMYLYAYLRTSFSGEEGRAGGPGPGPEAGTALLATQAVHGVTGNSSGARRYWQLKLCTALLAIQAAHGVIGNSSGARCYWQLKLCTALLATQAAPGVTGNSSGARRYWQLKRWPLSFLTTRRTKSRSPLPRLMSGLNVSTKISSERRCARQRSPRSCRTNLARRISGRGTKRRPESFGLCPRLRAIVGSGVGAECAGSGSENSLVTGKAQSS